VPKAIHFEAPAKGPKRAAAFYKEVFGLSVLAIGVLVTAIAYKKKIKK
jgi:predicted enzyme related to lactoylglutathione lyase